MCRSLGYPHKRLVGFHSEKFLGSDPAGFFFSFHFVQKNGYREKGVNSLEQVLKNNDRTQCQLPMV